MDGHALPALLTALVAGVTAGAAAWAAIRVELKYLRRDIERAHARITTHEALHHETKA